MFENTFKNIDDVLWKEAGCSSELDYIEQSSWMLFLKYLDDLEQEKAMEAELMGRNYDFIIRPEFRWSSWAAPKKADGSFDHDTALKGDDLVDFAVDELFPYLRGFKQRASSPDTIEYKIGEIFGEIKCKFQSGYSLRDALELVDELRFGSQAEKHELSALYEVKIKNMGNAGRNGGEYYTPRPLIRAMVQVTNPQLGERVYDPAVGSAGFLCEAFTYMRQGNLSTDDLDTLQARTFYGKEKKSLAYVIGVMNLILHGIEAPNIIHTNTLSETIADIQERNRYDVILANPPFGGKERGEVQQNFPIKAAETATLFLQHFIKSLRAGGRAAIVIKNTFLTNDDAASCAMRRELLETCNLHTVLDCPIGTFQGAGVKAIVLFFIKGEPTKDIWFYQLDPGRNLGKTNPLRDRDLSGFVALQATRGLSAHSWIINVDSLDADTWRIPSKNPNRSTLGCHETLDDIIGKFPALETADRTATQRLLNGLSIRLPEAASWDVIPLGKVCTIELGKTPARKNTHYWDPDKCTENVWLSIADLPKTGSSVVTTSKEHVSDAGARVCKTVPKGTLLMSFKLTIGRLAFAGRDLFTNEAIAALTPIDPSVVSPEYLYWYFRAFDWDAATEDEHKVKGKTLNKAKLAKLPVLRPPPEYQAAIVNLLSQQDLLIDEARRAVQDRIDAIDMLQRAVMRNIFDAESAGAQSNGE